MPDRQEVVMLARYNAWQNRQMQTTLESLPRGAVTAPAGLHFGIILATLNHLLWADRIWMSRLSDWPRPTGGIGQGTGITPTLAAWGAERFRADARLILWADALRAVDLRGTLRWQSGATGRVQEKPLGQCLLHLFTHQAHHRGQIHAAVTALGAAGWTTDLAFMPEGGHGPETRRPAGAADIKQGAIE